MIKIIGIGRCGNNILEFFKEQNIINIENDYDFISVKHDADIDSIEYKEEDKIFTISGFGGNSAAKLIIDLTKKVIDKNYQLKNIIIFPFNYETTTQKAIQSIAELSAIHRNIEIFPNDALLDKNSQDKTMAELMRLYDSEIFNTITIHDKRQLYRSFVTSVKHDDEIYTAIVHFWSKAYDITLIEPTYKIISSSNMMLMIPSRFAFKDEDKSSSSIQNIEEIAHNILNNYIEKEKEKIQC